MSAFAVLADHRAHLPVGATTVTAVVSVRALDGADRGVHVSLRLWTPLDATVAVLRECSPARMDLTGDAVHVDDRTVQYDAGCWTAGERVYELEIALPTRTAGDQMLAARFGVVVAGDVVGGSPIAVAWTDDERLIAASARRAEETPSSAAATEDLPTGPSPQPRHVLADEASADQRCPGCGLSSQPGDRFCEGCGQQLGVGRPA